MLGVPAGGCWGFILWDARVDALEVSSAETDMSFIVGLSYSIQGTRIEFDGYNFHTFIILHPTWIVVQPSATLQLTQRSRALWRRSRGRGTESGRGIRVHPLRAPSKLAKGFLLSL